MREHCSRYTYYSTIFFYRYYYFSIRDLVLYKMSLQVRDQLISLSTTTLADNRFCKYIMNILVFKNKNAQFKNKFFHCDSIIKIDQWFKLVLNFFEYSSF